MKTGGLPGYVIHEGRSSRMRTGVHVAEAYIGDATMPAVMDLFRSQDS